jgi:hypothetical protein
MYIIKYQHHNTTAIHNGKLTLTGIEKKLGGGGGGGMPENM